MAFPTSRRALSGYVALLILPAFFAIGAHTTDAQSSLQDEVETLAKIAQGFPARGEVPKHFRYFGILGQDLPTQDRDPELAKKLSSIATKLGANTLEGPPGGERNRLMSLSAQATPATLAEAVGAATKEAQRLRVVALPPLPPVASAAANTGEFHNLLRRKGYRPEDLGLRRLEDAMPEYTDKSSKLYYPSVLFAWEQGLPGPGWNDATEKVCGVGAQVGARPVAKGMYDPGFSRSLLPYRLGRLNLPWVADRCCLEPELSPQVQGLAWAVARSAAKYLDQPFMASLTVDSRYQNGASLRRSYYQALGQGAKLFCFDGAVLPGQGQGERSIKADDAELWKSIHDLIHETGVIEKYAFVDMPRPADIAFMISLAEEVRGHPQSVAEELKALYVACRRSGYAVDVLSEEDVQRGRAKEYLAIFFVGNHLERKTAVALRDWVKAGGSLAAYGGGGFLDEHGQPMEVLQEIFGVTEANLEQRGELSRPKDTAMPTAQLGRWKSSFSGPGVKTPELPVWAAKLRVKPTTTTKVLGHFEDGMPAALHQRPGAGASSLFAGYFASSWARAALPRQPWRLGRGPLDPNHFVPHDFDGELSDHVTAGSDESRYHVVTDNLDVETILMQGPKGLALVCINWSPLPQTALLTIQFAGPNYNKAVSLERGDLKMQKIKDPKNERAVTYNFKITINVTDVVLLEP